SLPSTPAPPPAAAETTTPSTTAPATSTITLHTITVPMQPPLTPTQAEHWSSKMWPVVFNPAAPRALIAPPPQILSRVRDAIAPKAGRYLALAQAVAAEAERSGLGRGVGAVVVDPELEQTEEEETEASSRTAAIVAVAGDGRYSRREGGQPAPAEIAGGGGGGSSGPSPHCGTYDADWEGGPELHALMRAVELISSKRREDKPGSRRQKIRPVLYGLEEYFLQKSDVPLRGAETGAGAGGADEESEDAAAPPPEKYQKTTETEAHAIHLHHKGAEEQAADAGGGAGGAGGVGPRIRSREQGGYLCNDLDVYLSHEPCICCCMGLLLSRFRAVIFPRRGRMVSGGLASEPVVKPVPVEAGSDHPVEEEAEGGTEEASTTNREYYGLHWRKELNWRALGFEFVAAGESEGASAETGVAFHA
ncbi:hypothetical protein BP00DRAFT_160177, partial [Aspergillus indologenus CBS 114.80]